MVVAAARRGSEQQQRDVPISPSLSLYRMVVLPAASRPTIRMRISFLPIRPLNNLANTEPMMMMEEVVVMQKHEKRHDQGVGGLWLGAREEAAGSRQMRMRG